MSRAGAVVLAVLALPVSWPAVANQLLDRLLNPTIAATAYSANPDLVTAYSTEMSRYRLRYGSDSGFKILPVQLTPIQLRAEFRVWTWRAEDGSLLQGFRGSAGFRLTSGNCLSRICTGMECSDDGWPMFKCSDGRRRRMTAVDFTTAIFDEVRYVRLSAGASKSLPMSR
jgi:hypothetical protein